MMLLSLMVAVALFLANRRAAGEPAQPEEQSARRGSPE
ncbi:MAG: hypothetical protein HW394_1915, partial [Acidobacteria bacterium]|nr:hypothetical protein [Acidobacteriota bacterium]